MQKKIFKTEDLYIARIYKVSREYQYYSSEYEYVYNEIKDAIVVYENHSTFRIIDIFTGKRYYITDNEAFLNECAENNTRISKPNSLIPLTDKYFIDKEEISLDELRFYQRDLIDKKTLKKHDELVSKYNRINNDIILMYINNAIDYLDVLVLNNESKEKYKKELYNIASNYINEIINLKKGMYNNSNNLVTIATIRRKYISLIIEIEDELFNIETIDIQNLKDDLKEIKLRLK